MTSFACQGQRPSSSTSKEKLRKVRMKTMLPRTATSVIVGCVLIVAILARLET
jgi:hypothetical protein